MVRLTIVTRSLKSHQAINCIFVSSGFPGSFRTMVSYNHMPLLSLSMLPEHNPIKTCSLPQIMFPGCPCRTNISISSVCVLFLYYHLLRMLDFHQCFILEIMGCAITDKRWCFTAWYICSIGWLGRRIYPSTCIPRLGTYCIGILMLR